jgi:TolB-like protein
MPRAWLILAPLLLFAAGAEAKSLFVRDVSSSGVDEATRTAFAGKLLELLTARAELDVVTTADFKSVIALEKQRRLAGCDPEEPECASELHTELLLSATIGKVGARLVFTMSLIEARSAEVLNRATDSAATIEEILQILPAAIEQLFGPAGAAEKYEYQLPPDQKISFAVFDLEAAGLDEHTANNLTQVLSVEIKRIDRATVIGPADIKALIGLERMRRLAGQDCDESCAAELGNALGVDKLIVGSVGRLGGAFVVSLRLIDPRQLAVESRVSESYSGAEEQLLRAVRHAARRLLGVAPERGGTLAVGSTYDEAELYIDNKRTGILPRPPVDDVAAGRHTIRVVKDGFFEWRAEIYVDPGEVSAVWVELSERPEKWYQKWWVWAAAGAAITGAAVGTALVTRSGPDDGDIFVRAR